MLVAVDVAVGVLVIVGVGVFVGVSVGVGVTVGVSVAVGVFVGVFVGVNVGVSVGVNVGVAVSVAVGVFVGVFVGVSVGDVPERLAGVNPSVIVDRTASALAKGIVAMVSEPNRSNGREIVEAISLDRVAARIVAVYARAVEGRRKSEPSGDT